MPDLRRYDAAIAVASIIWVHGRAVLLPLTAANPAIHGARLAMQPRWGRFRWADVAPV